MRFILGLLIGAGLGAAFGLMAAPQSGSETRQALQQRVRRGAEETQDAIPDA
ncbi:MAG: YtxH domain-containing protein [Dehalococcoidia bacterium]